MPRRKTYPPIYETGNGLLKTFTERVMPVSPDILPIETIVEYERISIDRLLDDMELFAEHTEDFFETKNTAKLMQDIKQDSPHMQHLLLQYANRYRNYAHSLNNELKRLYHINYRLLFYTIQECAKRLKPPYDFSVVSRFISMLLGRYYILNKVPSTLPTNYTAWRK